MSNDMSAISRSEYCKSIRSGQHLFREEDLGSYEA